MLISRPIRYQDTERYQQLIRELAFYNSTDPHMRALDATKRDLIEREIADGQWEFEHPGLTGSYRVALNGHDCTYSVGAPRFESVAETRAYIHSQGYSDYPGISVIHVVTRPEVEAHNRRAAKIVPFPKSERRFVPAVVTGGAA